MRNSEKVCHKAHSSTCRGGWEGRFCCPGFPPPCAYQRYKKKQKPNNQQTVSAAHRDLTKTSHQTLHPEKKHFFKLIQRYRIIYHLIFLPLYKKKKRGVFGEGVAHASWRSYYRDPDFFMASLFGSWGREEESATFLSSLNDTNGYFITALRSPSAFSTHEDILRGG